MRLDEIIVEGRVRKDLGDITPLAESIAAIGLLHPVVVNKDGKLISGERRMAAVRSLGWVDVPVTVAMSIEDENAAMQAELRAEQEENTLRKDFTPGEAHAMWTARKVQAEAEAKQRQREGAAVRTAKATDPHLANSVGKVEEKRDHNTESSYIAAQGTGYSAATMQRVDRVKAAQADPNPAVAARATELVEQIDSGAVKPLTAAREIDQIRTRTKPPKVTNPPSPPTPATPRLRQRRIDIAGRIDKAITGMSNLTYAFDEIPDDVDAEAATTWVDDLKQVRRTITQFINRLEGSAP